MYRAGLPSGKTVDLNFINHNRVDVNVKTLAGD